MEAEERGEVGLGADEEPADVHREHPGEGHEHAHEHVGDRGGEVPLELAPEDHQDVGHQRYLEMYGYGLMNGSGRAR